MQDTFDSISSGVDLSPENLGRLNERFEKSGHVELLRWGFETFGQDMVLGTGFGPSGVFLIHQLQEQQIDIPIFYLDTQLLFDSTYELRDIIEQKYGISITRVSTGLTVKEQAEKYGDQLWKRNPNRCCYLRKVKPLRNYLSDKKAWITGVRRSQSESRRNARMIEWDPENEVVKINPLVRWKGTEIWDHIHRLELPYNPMHDEGYPSIGCIPCTKPVYISKESDDRKGRWDGRDKTECGIHVPAQILNSKNE
ncbi:MAG: phosphoadenylyl-sulfate reductase [Balneolaceae bacterium]